MNKFWLVFVFLLFASSSVFAIDPIYYDSENLQITIRANYPAEEIAFLGFAYNDINSYPISQAGPINVSVNLITLDVGDHVYWPAIEFVNGSYIVFEDDPQYFSVVSGARAPEDSGIVLLDFMMGDESFNFSTFNFVVDSSLYSAMPNASAADYLYSKGFRLVVKTGPENGTLTSFDPDVGSFVYSANTDVIVGNDSFEVYYRNDTHRAFYTGTVYLEKTGGVYVPPVVDPEDSELPVCSVISSGVINSLNLASLALILFAVTGLFAGLSFFVGGGSIDIKGIVLSVLAGGVLLFLGVLVFELVARGICV